MSLSKHKNQYRNTETDDANLDDWLGTYGDMITLLMSFFIILISVSTIDTSLFEQIKQGVQSQMKSEPIKTPLADIKKSLDSLLEKEKQEKKVFIKMDGKGILMEFASSAFYSPGEADMGINSKKIIDKVTQALNNITYYPFSIDIEGHTDDVPIHTAKFPSNWELSVSRATNIVKYMIEMGVHPDRLKAAGYADTKPKAPNLDNSGKPIPDNRDKNRRIVIQIH
jgi:chemotaxis protein MotB